MSSLPLVDNQFLIEKRAAQSGFDMSNWTYVIIPGIPPEYKARGGTIRVRGFIDSYELKQYNLLPMKDQRMFLPLNTTVRKKIGKKEGDYVHVVLFQDVSPLVIPEDILACLLDAPLANQFFLSLSESNQKYYIDWIEGAKKMETKVERIQKAIERLENGLKFYDWVNQE
ncbi:MAG: YdeI/OmpD-associated family protein [Haliscomenobacter sp.]|uniref:YdeI/OmpD-associated family protein n=1 Tax=Haliscomenobacter sp. TaxID=2717303 RepID=UPI0029B489AA|nr:YdeI/OmpD-associated family protein [Haliscomenobacter sp.]MDX2070974.1 YdeI/OmpD-associated family protein [Haliscomenobacter sp.]